MLVTGAGPIGLLAALLGKQRGLEVHVLDRVESGPKPELVRALGRDLPHRHRRGHRIRAGRDRRMHRASGRSSPTRSRRVGAGRRRVPHGRRHRRHARSGSPRPTSRQTMVLQNNVVVGSVNANKRHWYKAGEALARADRVVAGAPRHAARAAGGLQARPRSGSRTTSRSSSSSPKRRRSSLVDRTG